MTDTVIPRLILILWPLALADMIVGTSWLSLVLGGVFAIYLIASLRTAHLGDRLFAIAVTGLALLILTLDRRLADLPAIFARTVVFAAFVPSAQFLRSLAESDLRVARYRDALQQQPQSARPIWLLIGSAVLGSVMTVGAVAILSPLFADLCDEDSRREDAVAALTGTALAINWSPFFVAMAVVTAFFPMVPFWQAVSVGLGLSFLGLFLAFAMLRVANPFVTGIRAMRALGGFVPMICVAGLMVVLLRVEGGFSTLEAGCLAIPPLGLLLVATGARSRSEARTRIKHTLQVTRMRIKRVGLEIGIVALAFMLGLVLRDSPTVDALVMYLQLDGIPGPLLLLLIPAAMIVSGLLAVHPIVSASLLMALFAGNHSGVSDLALLGATLAGWSAAAMLSYSGLLMMVTTSVTAVPRSRLILSRNTLFGPAFALAAALLLATLDRAMV